MSKVKLQNTRAQAAESAPPPSKPSPLPAVHTPPLFRPVDWITLLITTLVVFVGYYLTLAPNLTLEDSGELAVGSFYAGIPHPPGYPVWTMYTWLFTEILHVSNIAWRVGVASAVAGALSCGLLAFLVSRGSSMMIEGIAEFKDFDRRWENAICVVSGFVAGALLGFNGFMWSQSVIVEVYSFCVLSLMAVLLFLLRWTYSPHQHRYLYLAFFAHGICFNNHQSLLVVALGMEVLVLMAEPKLARDLFFWNTIIYIGGLVVGPSVLTSNAPVYIIFNIIGIASAITWGWLAIFKAKAKFIEIGRDLALVAVLGYLALVLGMITNFVPVKDNWKIPIHLVGIGAIVGLVQLIRMTTSLSKNWLYTLVCGGSWIAGAAFYLYMPLAGMSNPPMQWGYPRTVEGFFHAFTRGQYEKIHPTSGGGDTVPEMVTSFFYTYGKQMWMYLQGVNDEFNLVYLLIALALFLFYRRMQAREKAWMLGMGAIYLCLGPFLVLLLNPGLDRQAVELNRVFFTASHVLIAMGVGYGLTLIAVSLATNYQPSRFVAILGSIVAIDLALYSVGVQTYGLFGNNTGYDPASIFTFLKYVFAALTCTCVVLAFFRLFFLQTSGQHQFLVIAGLSLIGLACLFTTSPQFLNPNTGIEETTATGFAKVLCWLLAGIAFYFASRLQEKGGRVVLLVFGGLLSVVSVVMTLSTVLGNQLKLKNLGVFTDSITKAFHVDQYALPVFAGLILLAMTLAFIAALFVWRKRSPLALSLVLFAAMPLYSVLSHWADNEQRGHMFGYWFGHDMFTPPFGIYPEMTKDAVLYGGTDPGRFCPTYMIFDESFIPPECKKDTDPKFDRRDVYIITQNALADGTYLNYIRAHYNRSAQKMYKLDTPFFQELVRSPQERAENYETNIISRMLIPLDKLFTGIGESIEKKRRAGSSFFKESDFKDLKAFIGKLRAPTNGISEQLSGALSQQTRALLTGGDEKELSQSLSEDLNKLLEKGLYDDKALAKTWEDRWKIVFNMESIQNEKRRMQLQPGSAAIRQIENIEAQAREALRQVDVKLNSLTEQTVSQLAASGVPVSPYLKSFISEAPQSFTRIRLMRLLLEAAYPTEISASPGGVYPDREIYIASPADSQRCFDEYINDAQRRLKENRLKPGEGVTYDSNSGRVQVSGQVAVMAINGLLTKVMFDANPENEFYVEESFPLDWMYPHLTPSGVIMKINRQPLSKLTDDILDKDHEFWSKYSDRLIGNWITYDTPVSNIVAFVEKVYLRHDWSGLTPGQRKFVRDDQGQKAFSKLRSSISGVYAWRLNPDSRVCPPEYRPKSTADFQRLTKEADFAFRQAFAFCPYSPEAVFRYVNFLLQFNRLDDALLVAQTCSKLDPFNAAAADLVNRLGEFKKNTAQADESRTRLQSLEQEFARNASNYQAGFELASAYFQMQQPALAEEVLDRMLNNPGVDANVVKSIFSAYAQLTNWGKVETTLEKMTNIMSGEPEVWYDLAAMKSVLGKPLESIQILAQALDLSAKRRLTNPAARDMLSEARNDGRLNPIRHLPEFQKLVPPQ